MTILLLLVPISVLLLGAAAAAFAWAVRSGQFDDLDTPAVAMLADAAPSPPDPVRSVAQTSCAPGPRRLRSAGSDGAWNWSWPLARAVADPPRQPRTPASPGERPDAGHAD